VADIIAAIDEADGQVRSGAQRDGVLNTQDLWDSLNSAIFEHMKTITLKSLAEDQKSKGFKVEERKAVKKPVLQKIKSAPHPPRVPNSVFALGQVWSRS
jgi:Rrf2 family iron-sulfur cluster assembly transcriptional regulator